MTGAHRAEAEREGRPFAQASLVVPTADAMRALGERVAAILREGDLVVLSGDLGAGKTTFTQGIGAALGVRSAVTSPTFVIARVHPATAGGPALVHVDAFRLGSLAEIDDLDLDASLAESITVVEWGRGLVEDLAPAWLEVVITRSRGGDRPGVDGADLPEADGDEERRVAITGFGARWDGVELPVSVG